MQLFWFCCKHHPQKHSEIFIVDVHSRCVCCMLHTVHICSFASRRSSLPLSLLQWARERVCARIPFLLMCFVAMMKYNKVFFNIKEVYLHISSCSHLLPGTPMAYYRWTQSGGFLFHQCCLPKCHTNCCHSQHIYHVSACSPRVTLKSHWLI